MKKILTLCAALMLLSGAADAASCAIPPGTYTFLHSNGHDTYYFNDTLTILESGGDKILKTGDFSVNASGRTYQRTGDQFTYVDGNGSYTSLKNGTIYFTPAPKLVTMAAALPPETAYPAPEGMYTKQSDGRVTFVGAITRPDLVITEENCGGGTGTVYTLDSVIADLGAQTHADYIAVNLSSDVLFDFNSSAINLAAAQNLNQVIYLANQKRKGKVIVRGHTDAIGSDEANLKLSNERAASVAAYLQSHGGPALDFYLTQGLGEAYPVAPNTNPDGSDNPEGRAQNRRVEVLIQTVEGAPVPEPVAIIQSGTASITTHKDGTQVIKGDGGATIIQKPDGSSTFKGDGGASINVSPDGRMILKPQ